MADALFDLELGHGRCVGLQILQTADGVEALAQSALGPEERDFAATLAPPRRRTWVAGRAALRLALGRAGLPAGAPILADDRGAPRMPAGVTGSISHKQSVAVALVAPELEGPLCARVGVDVEVDAPSRVDIAARVLAPEELASLEGLAPDERTRQVLVRFSAKEAVYKALDPFVRRYVGFHEVLLSLRPDGTAATRARLQGGEGPFGFEVTWQLREGLVLTTARVTRL